MAMLLGLRDISIASSSCSLCLSARQATVQTTTTPSKQKLNHHNNPSHSSPSNQPIKSNMAGQFPMGDLALDQKQGESRLNNAAAESWLEPLLLKSNFYRKHFTRDGRTESKSTRRGSAIEEDIAVRKNSISARRASEESAQAVPAPAETVV
jgi:hypothetical protein